jgi:hypothetical protein
MHVHFEVFQNRSDALLAQSDFQESLEQLVSTDCLFLIEASLHRRGGPLGRRFQQLLVLAKKPSDILQSLAHAVGVPFLVEVRVLVVGIARDLGDPHLPFAQLYADVEDFVHRHRGA